MTEGLALLLSLGDGVNVIIVGRVDLTVVAQGYQSLIESIAAHSLLDDVPDVTLVDELVSP